MKCIQLFTKEEIEKYGFVYEPDESKCKEAKCRVIYTTYCSLSNGKFKVYPPVFENNPDYTKDDFQRDVAVLIDRKYINSIFAWVPRDEKTDNDGDDSKSDFHAHVRVCFKGHTNFNEEERNQHSKEWEERIGLV